MWVALLKEKSYALEQFKRFKFMAEVENKVKLKCLRSDPGGEFISEEFKALCEKSEIKRQFTAPCTQQHNGVVETDETRPRGRRFHTISCQK